MKKSFISIFILSFFIVSINSGFAQDEILKGIINSVSPIEIPALIKELGVQYDRSILNSSDKAGTYQTDYKKALNLGVYSTDLGYANINGESRDALTYLTSLKKLALDLNVGQFIDFNKILSLAANKDNLNKLLEETSITFENMSNYLQEKNKSNIAALILTGGWIETLHITCEVAQKQPGNKELTDRIVGQKFILEQILKVLQPFTDTNIKKLNTDLLALNKLFSKYSFEASTGELEAVEIDGILTYKSVSGNGKEIVVTPQELTNISGVVSTIRQDIIK